MNKFNNKNPNDVEWAKKSIVAAFEIVLLKWIECGQVSEPFISGFTSCNNQINYNIRSDSLCVRATQNSASQRARAKARAREGEGVEATGEFSRMLKMA